MIKRISKWVALFLLLSMVLPLATISAASSISGTKTSERAKYAELVSIIPNITASVGDTLGPHSTHGGNQNRVCRANGATYACVLTDKDKRDDYGGLSLIQIKDDGTITRLVNTDARGANVNGVTGTVMADADGNIWAYSGWDDYNTSFETHLWFYDTHKDDGTVEEFVDKQVFSFGNSAGYSVASLDAARGKVYATISGGLTPGFLTVKPFDIATRTWGKMTAYKLPSRAQYIDGFPNTKGGLLAVGNRGPSFRVTICNTGETVATAIDRLHNQKVYNNYTFDSVYLINIEDPDTDEKISSNVSVIDVDPPVYDVERGLYPQVNHYWQGDVYMDSHNYLHVFYSNDDNNGTYGDHLLLKTFDVANGLKELGSGELDFLYGFNAGGSGHWFEDTQGRLWMIASENSGKLEAWLADDELGTSFTFIYEFDLPNLRGQGSVHICNARNNSDPSDIATILCEGTYAGADRSDWTVVRLDLGKLAELKGLNDK